MFVKNSTGVLKKVMVCPPKHLQLQPINEISRDWINKGELDSQRETALREWGEFVQAYRDNGVEVVEVTPDPSEPLMVFARDFGGCVAEGVIMGHFREPCRWGESAILRAVSSGFWMTIHSPSVWLIGQTGTQSATSANRWKSSATMLSAFRARRRTFTSICALISLQIRSAWLLRSSFPTTS